MAPLLPFTSYAPLYFSVRISLKLYYKAAYYKGGGTNAGYWVYPTQSDTAPGNLIGGVANQANYYNGVYAVTQSSDYSDSINYLTDAGAFSGSAGAYDTFDQGGNMFEWNDAVIGSSRGIRGGSWANGLVITVRSSDRGYDVPSSERSFVGFRVASVSAPVTNVILTVEEAATLSGDWQFVTEINVGPMTNTSEFYRLKIRTVVE